MEKSASEMLENFWTSMLSQLLVYFAVFMGVLILYGIALYIFRDGKRSRTVPRVYDVPGLDDDISGGRGASHNDGLLIGAPVIPAVPMPQDGQFFHTVLAFAQAKFKDGRALYPEERFALGEVAFAERLLTPEGLLHFDSFKEKPPYKGFELRQAMERIGAPQLGELFEQATAIYLHRFQLTSDMTRSGMPIAQALAHPDLPQYDAVSVLLLKAGGQARLIAAADIYFHDRYPWAETS